MTHIILYRGNDKVYELVLTNKVGGGTYDLADCRLDFYVKKRVDDPNDKAVIHKSSGVVGEIDINNPTDGTAKLYIVPDDTVNLLIEKTYVYDIELETAKGQKYTILRGRLNLFQD